MAFSGSPVLFYNVGVWGKLGFGVPNWGKRLVSRNIVLLELVETIGRNLQAIMLSDDALSRSPPSMNMIIELNKLMMRARQLLATEMTVDNQIRMQGDKGVNDKQSFNVFPCPIFMVRNRWLKTYAYYAMHALAEAMQATENSTSAFEITNVCAGQIGQYFTRILKRMSCELLNISPSDPTVPKGTDGLPNWEAFVLTDAQIRNYKPSQWFSTTELIDTAFPLGDLPSDYDVEPLSNGIPVIDLPPLTAYPVTVPDSEADLDINPSAKAQGLGNSNPLKTGDALATAPVSNTPAFVPAPGNSTGAPSVSPVTGTNGVN